MEETEIINKNLRKKEDDGTGAKKKTIVIGNEERIIVEKKISYGKMEAGTIIKKIEIKQATTSKKASFRSE